MQAENRQLQTEFWQVFKDYDECVVCELHCCFGRINRFDFVDCFLNCLPLKKGQSAWHKMSHLSEILIEPQKIIHFGGESSQNCSYHSSETGCTLAVGERPLMCITGVCLKFVKALSHKDLKDCSRLINKSIRFHFKCFFLICANLLRYNQNS